MKTNTTRIAQISLLFILSLCVFYACTSKAVKKDDPEEVENENKDSIEVLKTDSVTTTNDTTLKSKTNEQTPLTLTFKNLESLKAPILVTFYQKKHKFLSLTDILKTYTLKPDGKSFTSTIEDLEYGEYAIASFQDVNSDGVIDKNLLGIPKEPFGFSNNYKPTVKAPNYDNCKFVYNKTKNTIVINMIMR